MWGCLFVIGVCCKVIFILSFLIRDIIVCFRYYGRVGGGLVMIYCVWYIVFVIMIECVWIVFGFVYECIMDDDG